MSRLDAAISERPITQLAIPGSHHSASADVDPKSEVESNLSPMLRALGSTSMIRETMAKWMQHQKISVKEQLESGIRYFDFSIEHTANDRFFVVNGLRCNQIDDYLDDLYRFLSEQSREIVIVKMDKFTSFSSENLKDFERFIEQKFGDLIVKQKQNADAESLAEWSLERCWRKKKQIIFLFDTAFPLRIAWPISRYAKVNQSGSDCVEEVIDRLKDTTLSRELEVLQIDESVLSLQLSDALRNPMTTFEKQYGRQATREIVQFIRKNSPKNLNVVAVDFCEEADFAQSIIALNK
ncbi:unnamed protein product, partial [Mesorhabditis belari]|uniref:Phosphatidylinositol-specific phospholipase C X domain-containing protein n=1 Tax=Mesorhabditis belari TaxID=2138241 RepID=A0AAF3F3P2_9BILA